MTSAEMTTFNSGNPLAGEGGNPMGQPPQTPSQAETSNPLLANRTNLLLVAMFATGIGVVYLLSLREGPEIASADQKLTEARVDVVLASLAAMSQSDGVKSGRAMDVINTFYYQARERQIDVARLKANPFIYSPVAVEVPKAVQKAPAPAPGANAAVEQEDKAMAEVRNLQLQSVLSGGSSATAMISNNLLTVGQTIRGWKVTRIESNKVTLAWRDKQHILWMPR